MRVKIERCDKNNTIVKLTGIKYLTCKYFESYSDRETSMKKNLYSANILLENSIQRDRICLLSEPNY